MSRQRNKKTTLWLTFWRGNTRGGKACMCVGKGEENTH